MDSSRSFPFSLGHQMELSTGLHLGSSWLQLRINSEVGTKYKGIDKKEIVGDFFNHVVSFLGLQNVCLIEYENTKTLKY